MRTREGEAVRISGWGRFPAQDAEVLRPRTVDALAEAVAGGPLIARGLGRSYGDSSLADRVVDTTALDHLVAFDGETGVLTCEAGVTLADILGLMVPRGWFLPVTPGTRWVTIGGAVASDVHGKNHHLAGSFSDHVLGIRLLLASGEVVDIGPDRDPDLFRATCGGMGLTGVIVEVTFRLLPVASREIDESVVKAPTLDIALDLFDHHHATTYSVAWIDLVARGGSLGRSLVMLGEHAAAGDLVGRPPAAARVPCEAPSALLNRHTVAAFNALYYGRVRKSPMRHRVPYEPFFYPLDALSEWNRLYGRRGFLQWQCVIPREAGPEALREVVRRVSDAGLASPLAVLKVFGRGNHNHLSFPMPGYTLAIDLKADPVAFALCQELDELVVDTGGRLYLTKDSRMSPATFRRSYPQIEAFEAIRRRVGAPGVFASAQSRRLGLA